MAAGYCTQELEQAATQLLPRDIIAEIGIVDDDGTMSSAAVIEGLATHLATILGLAGMTNQHRPHNGGGGMMAHAAPGPGKNDASVVKMMFATTAPIAPPPAASADLLPTEKRQFGSGTGVFLPARYRSGTGTGVFMPLAGAYSARPFKSSRNRGAKPPRLMKEEAQMAMLQQDDNDSGRVSSPASAPRPAITVDEIRIRCCPGLDDRSALAQL